MNELRAAIADWYDARIAPKFWRSWSWRAAIAGLLGVLGPDAINVIAAIGRNAFALPVLDLQTKFWIAIAALVLVVVLRPFNQKTMPASAVAVAQFLVPRVVELVTGSGRRVQVAAQVVPVQPHDPRLDDPVSWTQADTSARPS
jgi:hypothetical protein